MPRYIATVHVHLDIEADTEEAGRAQVRARVVDAGMRLGSPGSGPSHSVDGVRLDIPLGDRPRRSRTVITQTVDTLGPGATMIGFVGRSEHS